MKIHQILQNLKMSRNHKDEFLQTQNNIFAQVTYLNVLNTSTFVVIKVPRLSQKSAFKFEKMPKNAQKTQVLPNLLFLHIIKFPSVDDFTEV